MVVDSADRITVIFNTYTSQYEVQSSFLGPAPDAGGPSLAETGVNAGLPLGIAAALLLSGAALVVLTRRTKKA